MTIDMVLNGKRFEITEDEFTGDWAVMNFDETHPQPLYFKSKQGAIDFCLVESSIIKRSEAEYEIASDKTSA